MLQKIRKQLEEKFNTSDVQFIRGNSKSSVWEIKVRTGDYINFNILAKNGKILEIN